MRRFPAAAAVFSLAALALVGCSTPSEGASCAREGSPSSALDLITVTDSAGSATAVLKTPTHVDATSFRDDIIGDGPSITSDLQDVAVTVSITNGSTGAPLVATQMPVMRVADWSERVGIPGVAKMLACATEGSRVVGIVGSSDILPATATGLGLTEKDSAVVLIDIEQVYRAAADGAPQFNDRSGMPSVVLGPDGRPGISVPANVDPPAELVVETLKKGDGAKIGASDVPRVHYTGVLWETGEVFDSSWDKGTSAAFPLTGVVPGFAAALEGQTVGSQVLAVIPPEQGYGAEAQGSIPGGSTLVFVVDILGVDDPTRTP